MSRSNAMKNALAQAYADEVAEASLHSADPGSTGANEITSIARSPITYSGGPAAGVITSDPGEFAVPNGTVMVAVGVWDGSGNFLDSYTSNTTFSADTLFKPSLRYTQN